MKKTMSPQMLKQIKTFWNWFERNEAIIFTAVSDRVKYDEVFDGLSKKLDYVSKRIGYILIETKKKPVKAKLIFTANGYRKLFPKINALVDNAPKLQNWEFQSLIQPKTDLEKFKQGLDNPYKFPDFELKISDIYFKPLLMDTFKKNMTILVFLKNYKYHYDNEFLEEAVQIIIQDLVGEVDFKRTISMVKLSQLPEKPKNLINLYQLKGYIDFLNKLDRRVKIEI